MREIQFAYPQDDRSWFRRSIEDHHKLRWSIWLPFVLSFAAVFVALGGPLLFRAAYALAAVWGIDGAAPVRSQPHSVEWLVTFLLVGVVIVGLVAIVWMGVITGWLVLVRKWSLRDASQAVVASRYPRHWFHASAV